MNTKRVKELRRGDRVQLTGGNGRVSDIRPTPSLACEKHGGGYAIVFSLDRDNRKSIALTYAGNERVHLVDADNH